MHFCHALYRLGGEQYLLPLASAFHYSEIKINFQLKEWSAHNEFLLLFTDAAMAWLTGMQCILF